MPTNFELIGCDGDTRAIQQEMNEHGNTGCFGAIGLRIHSHKNHMPWHLHAAQKGWLLPFTGGLDQDHHAILLQEVFAGLSAAYL
ncbi:hypothetical protein [Thiosocius teredinicola]|uniref:hypothetical protein n=1 Tax=Thiosocius teredinicola TaxID=1973002 RepID=UPI0013DDC44C